jgi:hypothetical protein
MKDIKSSKEKSIKKITGKTGTSIKKITKSAND